MSERRNNGPVEALIIHLATAITRDLFKVGDEPDSPTRRMAFIGGEYPDNERLQGGMCEEAMSDYLAERLRYHLCEQEIG